MIFPSSGESVVGLRPSEDFEAVSSREADHLTPFLGTQGSSFTSRATRPRFPGWRRRNRVASLRSKPATLTARPIYATTRREPAPPRDGRPDGHGSVTTGEGSL